MLLFQQADRGTDSGLLLCQLCHLPSCASFANNCHLLQLASCVAESSCSGQKPVIQWAYGRCSRWHSIKVPVGKRQQFPNFITKYIIYAENNNAGNDNNNNNNKNNNSVTRI